MENKINFVFPIAGAGSRFKNTGYETPKPLLQVHGRFFFEIAANALISEIKNYTLSFIVLKEHSLLFAIDEQIRMIFPKAKIVSVDTITDGAAETAYLGIKKLNLKSGTLVIADCDQWIKGKNLHAMFSGLEKRLFDMAVPIFNSDRPSFSYVTLDDQGRILQIVEKNPISDNAVAGCYCFNSVSLFISLYENLNDWGKEKYLSRLLAEGIDANYFVQSFELDTHIPFGTPLELQAALLNNNLTGEIDGW